MSQREATYTTLLMATGLTFGTISALFGFQNKIIDQRQYTILVTVVILSAFVPTLFAQKFSSQRKTRCTRGVAFIAADSRFNQSRIVSMSKLADRLPVELSENHKRSISVSLHLLDKALCQWEQWISGPISPGVMYQQQDTLAAAEKKELRTRINNLRDVVVRLRDNLNLAPERPSNAQLIVGQATILWEMLAELNSSSLHGYGAVSPQLAEYLDPLGESLTQQMDEISRLFSQATPPGAEPTPP